MADAATNRAHLSDYNIDVLLSVVHVEILRLREEGEASLSEILVSEVTNMFGGDDPDYEPTNSSV